MEGLAREFVEGQGGWRTGWRRTGVNLRDRDVEAERANGGDVKELSRLYIGPWIDECVEGRIGGGDDAVKGGIDLFERLQLLQAPHVGGTGFGRGFHRAEIADRLVGFLLGHGARAHQILPAARGDFGDVQVGLRGIQVRSSLQQLLVYFLGFDLRKPLSVLVRVWLAHFPRSVYSFPLNTRLNWLGVARRLLLDSRRITSSV